MHPPILYDTILSNWYYLPPIYLVIMKLCKPPSSNTFVFFNMNSSSSNLLSLNVKFNFFFEQSGPFPCSHIVYEMCIVCNPCAYSKSLYPFLQGPHLWAWKTTKHARQPIHPNKCHNGVSMIYNSNLQMWSLFHNVFQWCLFTWTK